MNTNHVAQDGFYSLISFTKLTTIQQITEKKPHRLPSVIILLIIHTRSSRDCGSPFGEHITLLASCFGLDSFCGVLAFGVDGVLLATCSRALRIYIHSNQLSHRKIRK